MTEPCPGCGARYAPSDDPPSHPYIGASSACWATFGELLAREFGDIAYGRVHRHSVDAYAAQHPGKDGRRERQSVALHLIAIAHWLEAGITTPELNRITQGLASAGRKWPWLEPPDPTRYRMTVVDVLKATNGEAARRPRPDLGRSDLGSMGAAPRSRARLGGRGAAAAGVESATCSIRAPAG